MAGGFEIADKTPSIAEVRTGLQRIGYREQLLFENYEFLTDSNESGQVPLVAFADQPADARSSCVAALFGDGDHAAAVSHARPVGSPYVLVLAPGHLEWWLQRREGPNLEERIPRKKIGSFFDERKSEFAPDRVFRAKTRGLFQADQQLTFVDAGLMPMVEGEIGGRLSALVGRVVEEMLSNIGQPNPSVQTASKVFQSAFWLLAGKLLRDKQVPSFKTLDLRNVEDAFRRVSRHYGSDDGGLPTGSRWDKAIRNAAETFTSFASLNNVTTESLSSLYESTLVPKQVRKELGIHATPSYLVDFMVWKMADWIEALPQDERHVFEPACGHGGFLVACVRLLRELLGDADDDRRKRFLRGHIHGLEVDPFAIELGRLRLTLADIPNPNGWDLRPGDMFASDVLPREAARAGVILANPPFENFSSEERRKYGKAGIQLSNTNKAAEMIARILPAMKPPAVLGLVVPQGFLHSKSAVEIRKLLAREFEIREICLFPDKVFAFSDMESAIILARRLDENTTKSRVRFGRVRERDIDGFLACYRVPSEQLVPQSRFLSSPEAVLRIPELDEVWSWLSQNLTLSGIAHIAKGLDYHGRDLPRGIEPISTRKRVYDVAGFAKIPKRWMIHNVPLPVWMTTRPEAIATLRSGDATGEPRIVVNYGRVSRGPWRLKAAIDPKGHAITSRFLAVRPLNDQITPEFLWAICNSPLANAFVYCHSMKRDVLAGLLRRMPVPSATSSAIEAVSRCAEQYHAHMAMPEKALSAEPDMEKAKRLLLAMDAEVLRLYDLPPRLERQLLDLFEGYQRSGVPFAFKGYYPPDFRPCLPLHILLSEEYRRSTAGELRKRATPEKSETVLGALSAAVEAYGED